MTAPKVAYTDEELQEFKELILRKLDQATRDYEELRSESNAGVGNDISDTSPTFKSLHDSAAFHSRGEAGQQAQRLLKFITGLQAALVRIEQKTYGICRETGKLIPKERLRAVPHATLSIEAKLGEKK